MLCRANGWSQRRSFYYCEEVWHNCTNHNVSFLRFYHYDIVQQLKLEFLCVCEGNNPPNLCYLLICCVRSHRGASEQVGAELLPPQKNACHTAVVWTWIISCLVIFSLLTAHHGLIPVMPENVSIPACFFLGTKRNFTVAYCCKIKRGRCQIAKESE